MSYMSELLGPSDAKLLEARHNREVSIADEIKIERRAADLLAEKLDSYEGFRGVLPYTEPSDFDSNWHRMFLNFTKARNSILATYGLDLPPNLEGFLAAFSNIDRDIRHVARVMLHDECMRQAEEEFAEGEL